MLIELSVICFGLLIGSFLSVCIYRIPAGRIKGLASLDHSEDDRIEIDKDSVESHYPNLSISSPARSFCPACNKQLYWWHNIPVLSWIILRGKCAFCQKPVSVRYPIVELLSAFVCYLSYYQYGLTLSGFLVYTFSAALIVISFIDYDYYIIPNVISLPGAAIGLVIGLVNSITGWFVFPICENFWQSLLGLVVGGLPLFLFAELYRLIRRKSGLGMGDIKLLMMAGAFFGAEGALYMMTMGALIGSVIGISLIIILRRKASHPIPFGPFLALGALLYLFVGMKLMDQIRYLITLTYASFS